MTLALQITVVTLCLLFSIIAIRLITSGRLQLKYSLIWFAFVVFALVCAVFPDPLFSLSALLGFQRASNFVLFIGLLFSLTIALSLTLAVSKHAQQITALAQENAILRNRIEQLGESAGEACQKREPEEEHRRSHVHPE